MNELLFPRMPQGQALIVLNSLQPQFVDTFVRSEMDPLLGTFAGGNENSIKDKCARVANQISNRYITPNFKKQAVQLACMLSEEDGENQISFLIPYSNTEYVSIKVKQGFAIHIRWMKPMWRETAHLMARLVYGNDLTGRNSAGQWWTWLLTDSWRITNASHLNFRRAWG